jgi:predicted AAA+ superfamily ATPase
MIFNTKKCYVYPGKESLFLWGARQTGKSTLLKQLFPDALLLPILLQVLL